MALNHLVKFDKKRERVHQNQESILGLYDYILRKINALVALICKISRRCDQLVTACSARVKSINRHYSGTKPSNLRAYRHPQILEMLENGPAEN